MLVRRLSVRREDGAAVEVMRGAGKEVMRHEEVKEGETSGAAESRSGGAIGWNWRNCAWRRRALTRRMCVETSG